MRSKRGSCRAAALGLALCFSAAAAPVLPQGTITAQCSALTPYSIALNVGANPATAGDVTTRRMRHTDSAVTTNNVVGYQLYQDAGRTNV